MPKTNFRPQTDGFAFVNYWLLDPVEEARLRKLFEVSWGSENALSARVTQLLNLDAPLLTLIAQQITNALAPLRAAILDPMKVQGYGLCGGMVYAALDYYYKGWVVPRGSGPADTPQHTTGPGTRLRDYFWKRLIDSFQSVVPTLLAWMVILHYVPKEIGGGAQWLLGQTRAEWEKLKRSIDAGQPIPLTLVGTTTSPGENHQVLAIGYDADDDQATIYLYDPNCPGVESTIQIDWTKTGALAARESCASPARGPLRGFFCETYTPADPPVAAGLSDGLQVRVFGAAAELRFTATNYGFSPSPQMRLVLRARDQAGGWIAVGGEQALNPLLVEESRTLAHALAAEQYSHPEFFAVCFLGVMDGLEIWRVLPPVEPGTRGSIAGGEIGAA